MLICRDNRLFMDGRGIYNFISSKVPTDIDKTIKKNNLTVNDIDLFLLHQGSKYIVKTIIKRAKLPQ